MKNGRKRMMVSEKRNQHTHRHRERERERETLEEETKREWVLFSHGWNGMEEEEEEEEEEEDAAAFVALPFFPLYSFVFLIFLFYYVRLGGICVAMQSSSSVLVFNFPASLYPCGSILSFLGYVLHIE